MVSKAKSGKIFEGEISRSLRLFQKQHKHSFFWHRLSDTMTYIGKIRGLILPKQPGDWIALHNGKFYLIEAKSSRGKRFRFDWFREHQREAMAQVEKCGGRSLLLLSFRGQRPVTCHALDMHQYIQLENQFKNTRKSIPQQAIVEAGQKLTRIRAVRGWNLSPLFKS